MTLESILNILTATGIFLAVSVLIGLLLAISEKYLKVEVDARFTKIESMLPGLNCGACGYPGCAGMTGGLLSGEAKKVSQCRPSNATQRAAIKEYLATTPGPDGKTITVDI